MRPVYWSWGAHTALAEAEIEYHDKVSTAIDVRFAAERSGRGASRIGSSGETPPTRAADVYGRHLDDHAVDDSRATSR